jgi:hypothetical protein
MTVCRTEHCTFPLLDEVDVLDDVGAVVDAEAVGLVVVEGCASAPVVPAAMKIETVAALTTTRWVRDQGRGDLPESAGGTRVSFIVSSPYLR